jgi:tetratricopeptide (TPR) repeat protein
MDFIDTRLDTWKGIARYLGRSPRTAQRWHSEYGLPVHHLGGDASSVFAYTDELEGWLRQRDKTIAEDQTHIEHRSDATSLTWVRNKSQPPSPTTVEFSRDSEREATELVAAAQKLWESLSASNLNVIARLYRKAIDMDASNAKAFAGLSQALIAQAVLGNLHPSAALHPAEAALQRALEIDAGLMEAQCASAILKVLLYRDWNGARKLLNEALSHHPCASQVLVGCALFAVAQGSLSEASHYLRKATNERPLNTSLVELLCWVEYLSCRFESTLALIADARGSGHSGTILDTVEALSKVLLTGPTAQIHHLESVIASDSRNANLLGLLGYAYGQSGQPDRGREVIDSLTRLGLARTFDFAYPLALAFLGIGNRSEAARWLGQSYRHGSLWSLGFGVDPILVELRDGGACRAFFGPQSYPLVDLSIESNEFVGTGKPSMPYSA